MNAKRILILGIALFCTLFGAVAMSEQRTQQHIQIAEIEVDPAQLDSYEAAVTEQIEAAIRLEPGVLVLYSVANKDNPAHVTVFEIYRDREAYLAHLQAPHFLKYKATVEKMVKSLKLIPVRPGHARDQGKVSKRWPRAPSATMTQCIDHKAERRRRLPATGIKEVIARIRLTPVRKDTFQTTLGEIRVRHLFGDVGQTMPR